MNGKELWYLVQGKRNNFEPRDFPKTFRERDGKIESVKTTQTNTEERR